MLYLENITKQYVVGTLKTDALKGITLQFRKSEFVAILGQSGCGKTTLLNIIGGLDRYTSGNLYINRRSTKEYDDHDWDSYRNRSVGFIFQSYNLIMHQTVLANVELALTMIGIGKEERRRRALEALESVGLADQAYKKPNQLSGGQMQRVAIARASINDPEILLADEPTGALDSESSVQVMAILKKLSENRLVIMVTHNAELAEEYATRIIRLKDGLVIGDTAPYDEAFSPDKTFKKERNIFKRIGNYFRRNRATRNTSMSFGSAIKLSANNLTTKKMRTFLTSFAGSIGIIGIALVLALSSGFSRYVKDMEENALSQYPLKVERTNMDLQAILKILQSTPGSERPAFPDADEVYVGTVFGNLLKDGNYNKIFHENDMQSLKAYLDANWDNSIGSLRYNYDITMNIYSNYADPDKYVIVNPIIDAMKTMMAGTPFEAVIEKLETYVSAIPVWEELVYSESLLQNQYEVLGNGRWPSAADEIVLCVDRYNQIDDYMLFTLGLVPASIEEVMAAMTGSDSFVNRTFSFEDLVDMEYRVMTGADFYYPVEGSDLYSNYGLTDAPFEYIQNNSMPVKVVGIVRPKEGVTNGVIQGKVGYTPALKEALMQRAAAHPAVIAQKATPKIDITTGAAFTGDRNYKDVMRFMGGEIDVNNPSSIELIANSFDSKEAIIAFLDGYNAQNPAKTIKYNDNLGMMMSLVSSLSNTVTWSLVGFTSISLLVSSIMIGIITYISVLERTKEIGILRSIGARKRDIGRVFNAETAILGLCSGVLGIIVTFILTFPVNAILKKLVGVDNLMFMVWWHSLVLICISVLLTLISGFIPARMAANKDPVTALRSES